MRDEDAKSIEELETFRAFAQAARLAVLPKSIGKRKPPEPDILCTLDCGENLAFELVELCDGNLARAIADPFNPGNQYVRTADPSVDVVQRKLQKRYRTQHPIELLCYTAGRIVTPPKMIIQAVRPSLARAEHVFRRAWLFSRGQPHLLWPEH